MSLFWCILDAIFCPSQYAIQESDVGRLPGVRSQKFQLHLVLVAHRLVEPIEAFHGPCCNDVVTMDGDVDFICIMHEIVWRAGAYVESPAS